MDSPKDISHFLCGYDELAIRMASIDPVQYKNTRNYLDGAVTWLSPFITHGIIGPSDIAYAVLQKHSTADCHNLFYELAWREYFHRVWEANGERIFSDMRKPCPASRYELPHAIVEANTGVHVIDHAISKLITHGFMHNHARMWVAGLCCNSGDTHWAPAARWMHYHLLDGDLASNTLSWQWIAGTFSNKRYVANQENVNKYSKTDQKGTCIDITYEQLAEFRILSELQDTAVPVMPQALPGEPVSNRLPFSGTVALRSIWQLNAQWRSDADHQLLFIDSDLHSKWPMSTKRWQFILHWASLIPGLQVVQGTIKELNQALENATVFRQSYTACRHWSAATHHRVWLYPEPDKPYNSFSQFWKQVKGHHGEK